VLGRARPGGGDRSQGTAVPAVRLPADRTADRFAGKLAGGARCDLRPDRRNARADRPVLGRPATAPEFRTWAVARDRTGLELEADPCADARVPARAGRGCRGLGV